MKKNNIKRILTGAVLCICVIGTNATVQAAKLPVSVEETEDAQHLKISDVKTAEAENEIFLIEKFKEEQEREEARIRAEKRQARKERRERLAREAEEARVAERQRVVDYALQFVGNSYVYGGTSLTNGADCSGFVQSVFRDCGYTLPRVAADQAYSGTQKTVEEMEVGDLLFYGYGGSITHVALYIGDGQIVHASTAATGIKISDYNYKEPCAVASYLA